MTDYRKKRIRRTNKQVLKNGKGAKRKHNRIAGRTGSIFNKKLKNFLSMSALEKRKFLLLLYLELGDKW